MDDLKVCRICLRTDKFAKYYKLEEFFLKCYYEEITTTPINNNDGLPKYFCYQCAAILNKYHFFKEKCCFAQKVLMQMARIAPLTYSKVCNMYSRKHPIIKRGIVDILKADKKVKTFNFREERHIFITTTKALNLNTDHESENFESHEYFSPDNNDSLDNDVPIDTLSTILPQVKTKDSSVNIILNEVKREDSSVNIFFNEVKKEDSSVNILLNVVESKKKPEEEPVVSEPVREVGGNKREFERRQNLLLKQSKKKNTTSVKKKNKFVEKKAPEVVHKPETEKRKFTKSKDGKVKSLRFLNSGFWKKITLDEEEAMNEFQAKAYSDKYLNLPHKCTDCLKAFSQQDILDRHQLRRHGETVGSLVCRFCKERFRWAHCHSKHMKQHLTKYVCLRCNLVCNLETSALFHEEYHSGVTRKCPHCPREFKHLSSFYSHLRTHRSKNMCSLCGESFVSPLGLRQHKRLKHVIAPDNVGKDGENNIYCDVCKITFETKEAYKKHLLHSAMHTDDSIPGGDVSNVNLNEDVLNEGENQSEDKDTDTPKELLERKSRVEKSLSAVRKKNLPTSVGTRRAMQRTTCRHCGKQFISQSACRKHHIVEHMRSPFHREEERVICEICGASLAPGSVAAHSNQHTRERTYACNTCGKSFLTKHVLKNHMVTHTGERNYVCNLCGKSYTHNGGLNLHYRTVHLKQPYIRKRRKKVDDPNIGALFTDQNFISGTQ